MDAFVALLTNDFHRSYWTDQEIGYAVARGVPIVPVRMPINPYGFIGKIQAGIGDLATPHALAENLVDRLLTHGHTETAMRDALVRALAGAQTYRASRATSKKLVRFGAQLTREQLHLLNTAMKTNTQIHHLGDVTSLLKPLIDRLPSEETGGAVDDDEIPF